MWALLDIRQGRANRMQFLLFVLFYVAFAASIKMIWPTSVMLDPKNHFSPVRMLYVSVGFYIFSVGLLRRYRDRGSQWQGILLVLWFALQAFLISTKDGMAVIMIAGIFLEFSGVGIILHIVFLLVFVWPLLRKGDPGPNEYGYPPVGMILGTMTRATYPPGLLTRYQAQERENDKDAVVAEEAYQKRLEGLYGQSLKQTEATFTETQEFKGRG